ncbi:MAG: hypothetical protein BGO90_14175 [Legionella sp. 40-6]|nr:oligosaccharide flippase family protein [Legionella sp.]OJY57978.1 MAG: hypothetical protein BGO90_14175 [Legionella sp. 40-6]
MSFKKNIIANYASQIYMSLAGIIILPFYLKFMSSEAYGLVGFFIALQSWFNILDLGLSPSISRETARWRGGAISNHDYRELMRVLQLFFFSLMIIGISVLYLSAPFLAHKWLQVHKLTPQDVQTAIQLMAISVGLRWMCGIYRAMVIGAERFVWLSYYTWIFTTLRYLGVLWVLVYIGTTPQIFFTYQIFISFFELLLLALKAWNLLPPRLASTKSDASLTERLQSLIPFALSVSLTSSIWILITQVDKLVLSRLLSLSEYGYFTLGVLAASGVMLFSAPFSMVLLPRLAKMKAEGNEQELLQLYRKASRFVATITIPAGILLALFPQEILWLWTHDSAVAQATAPVLRFYALGNMILAFTTFPYYLQYSWGNLRLHVIGNLIFASILIPGLVFATLHFGMTGAAKLWFAANLTFFSIWTAFVHQRFVPGLHWSWLTRDLFPSLFLSLLFLTSVSLCIPSPQHPFYLFCYFALITSSAVALNILFMRACAKGLNDKYPTIEVSA